VALAGFGADSLIEIVASTVVIWQLNGARGDRREDKALRVIAVAFALLAIYIVAQGTVVLATGSRPRHSATGILWLALTVATMLALAAGKRSTGEQLDNAALRTEARVTLIDGLLATAILTGISLNASLGWWWADPVSALVIAYYGVRESRHAWREAH
jgi:divalent metal cation (Fe/Co/Zn/Cd) transporter